MKEELTKNFTDKKQGKEVIKPNRCQLPKDKKCYSDLGICHERHCKFWFLT